MLGGLWGKETSKLTPNQEGGLKAKLPLNQNPAAAISNESQKESQQLWIPWSLSDLPQDSPQGHIKSLS